MIRTPRGEAELYASRLNVLVVSCLLALFAATGCSSLSLKHDEIARQSDGTVIEKITGFPVSEAPASPGNLSADSLRQSLKRILVQYHGMSSFSKSDPTPLLSDDQVRVFSAVLAKELPTLAGNQRIRFSFRDVRKRNLNQLNVYLDGAYIVFYFDVLVGNPKLALNAGDPPFSEASISELHGQTVDYALPAAVILKDPLAGTREAAEADVAGALKMLEEQRATGLVTEEEASRLRAFVAQHPEVRDQAWRVYWEKRSTLKKAREQGIMDEAGYNTQLAKIEGELTR